MPNPTPLAALEIFRHISLLDWRGLTSADHCGFAGAGEDARIAEVGPEQSARLIELLGGGQAKPEGGLIAIIGGDDTCLEFHGVDRHGEPLSFGLPLEIIQA